MNIIFLDIDGVLNSYAYHKETGNDLNLKSVDILSQIYHKFNCKIVLSSTWRELKDIPDESAQKMWKHLVDTLTKYGMEIYDITPTIKNNRPLEIATWLQNNSCSNFLILDDDFQLLEYKKYGLEKHVVKTIYFTYEIENGGLQEKHKDKAFKILSSNIL